MDNNVDMSQGNMKNVTKFSLRKSTQMVLVFVAYGWFGYFCLLAYVDYQKEMTGLNQFLTPVRELPLPAITVCSKDIFKNVSDETTAEMILPNIEDYVFTKEDLFHENFIWGMWDSHEIFSVQLGLCISIRARMNVTGKNSNNFWLLLKTGRKYKVGL